jgi:plastocyanin
LSAGRSCSTVRRRCLRGGRPAAASGSGPTGSARDAATADLEPRHRHSSTLATPEPAVSTEPPPGTVAISASNDSAYDQIRIVAPAEVPLTFRFANDDPYFTHNVAVREAKPDGSDFVGLPVAQMGTTVDYLAPALSAETFEIYCTVHPTMISTLVVE